MTVAAQSYYELVSRLPEAGTLILHHVDWEDYEDLLEAVGEAAGLRISYGDGILQVMTVSLGHEGYAGFIQNLVRLYTMRKGIRVRSSGSLTLKRKSRKKGTEPDVSFYIASANSIGFRKDINLEKDPPPDLAVEVDIHHDSRSKLSIYAALGIPEVWRFDGKQLIVYHLQGGEYGIASASKVLPGLNGDILTDFIHRAENEDENTVLLAFEDWSLRSK